MSAVNSQAPGRQVQPEALPVPVPPSPMPPMTCTIGSQSVQQPAPSMDTLLPETELLEAADVRTASAVNLWWNNQFRDCFPDLLSVLPAEEDVAHDGEPPG